MGEIGGGKKGDCPRSRGMERDPGKKWQIAPQQKRGKGSKWLYQLLKRASGAIELLHRARKHRPHTPKTIQTKRRSIRGGWAGWDWITRWCEIYIVWAPLRCWYVYLEERMSLKLFSSSIKVDRENFWLYSRHVSLTTKQQSCRLCADNSDIFPTSVFMENPVLLFLEMQKCCLSRKPSAFIQTSQKSLWPLKMLSAEKSPDWLCKIYTGSYLNSQV